MQQDFFFQSVEYPINGKQLASQIYQNPNGDIDKTFRAINGLADPNCTLYPGHFLLVPPAHGVNEQTLGGMKKLPQIVNQGGGAGMNSQQAQLVNKEFDIVNFLAENVRLGKEEAKSIFGGSVTYLKTRADIIAKDLGRLEEIYKKVSDKEIKLGSPEMQKIQASLKQQINGIAKKAILANDGSGSMMKNLGIKHSDALKQLRSNGNSGQIMQIGEAIKKTNSLGSKLKALGTAGKVLSFGASVEAIREEFSSQGSQAGFRKMGKESSGFLGSMGGGVLGAKAGGALATGALLAFGVGTGGLGFAVVGLCAAVGGLGAGYAGKLLAEKAYDETAMYVDQGGVDWIIEQTMH